MTRPHKDLSGQTFGKLKAISYFQKEGQPYYYYNCKCECGNEKAVRGSALITGMTKSCGCLLKSINLKHGYAKTGQKSPSYESYMGLNKNDLCDRWKGENGVTNFMKDMGEKPANTYLRRINFLKPYSKKNCVWFPYKSKEQ